MSPEQKLLFRLVAVAIPPVGGIIGVLIAFNAGGTSALGMFGGAVLGLLADAIYIPLLELHLVRAENSQGIPAAKEADTRTSDPELTGQVRYIVNSGNEPALIVEELRRLTEVRP